MAQAPRHVAIIMDGNGRWAQARGLPRSAGHKRGVEAVREAVKAAGELGVETLTLFSFSSENWNRPENEVSELMGLMKTFIRRDLAKLHERGIRISVIGSRVGVPDDVLPLVDEAVHLTRDNSQQRLVIAFNYGGRDEMARAVRAIAQKAADGEVDPAEIDQALIAAHLDTADWSDPDLVIRTSNEQRLSNFLLWQVAYSELVFLDCLWPDFSKVHFQRALDEYHSRDRRFGGVEARVAL